jgi:hypothetical protein
VERRKTHQDSDNNFLLVCGVEHRGRCPTAFLKVDLC